MSIIQNFVKTTLLAIPFSSPLMANEINDEYRCQIKNQMFLADNGIPKEVKNPSHKGQFFTIEKRTGRIDQPPLKNLTARDVAVITQGGGGKVYEVLSASSPTGKVTSDFIVVQEGYAGSEKPFFAVTSIGDLYTGQCITINKAR